MHKIQDLTVRFHTRARRSLSMAAAVAFLAWAATVSLHAEAAGAGTGVTDTAAVASGTPFSTAFAPAVDLTSLSYNSTVGASESSSAENFIPAVSADGSTDELQPPPRRRYGRPRYNDSSHNPDGSNKYTFEFGVGLPIPIGDTHVYNTPSYAFQLGAGRNFNKNFAVLLQFDWDNMGLQTKTLNNELALYNLADADLSSIGGNTHVWSFTLNPMYNFFQGNTLGAYVVGGFGFYHKVTTFTTPETGLVYTYFGYEEVEENASFDHYSSNAIGVNGGFGFTYKPSKFANEKFFVEGRYVFVNNSQRQGYTVANALTTSYTGYDFYPANSNRTTYIPIKVGIRF